MVTWTWDPKYGGQQREQPSAARVHHTTVEFYVGRQGGPLQIAHRQEGLVIPRGQHWDPSRGGNPDTQYDPGYSGGWGPHDGHPQAEYGKIWLLPYNTSKDNAETHQNASIWYDELIVSTQAIAAPGGGSVPPAPTPTPTPTPSVSMTANPTSVVSGGSNTLTWVIQNVLLVQRFRRLERQPCHQRPQSQGH